jgi:peptidoglycan/xylan/chitin deacetylase (PgdA/CDA1 family)
MRYRWPNGAQCAVSLTFDFDAESAYIWRDPRGAATRLDEIEQRRFGARTGVDRILRLLKKYDLPATFFTPGFTVARHTDVCKRIQDGGYELGCHGDVHEALDMINPSDEEPIMQRQLDIFKRYLGVRPVGYRSPSWSLLNSTPALLKQYDFVYDSSLMGDDIPYFIDTHQGPLAEVPIEWILDDAPYYRHVYGQTNQIAEPDRVVRQWVGEFQGMYRENACFVLTMHPWITGRAGRIDALEEFIRTVRQEPGVWWTTCLDIAKWQIESQQNLGVKVPIPAHLSSE